MRPLSRFTALLTSLALSGAAAAQEQWKQVRPSNTGIPGIQLHFGCMGPGGTVWVAGRWPFWGEGGVGIYDPAADLWTTLSNVDTPIPSDWVNEVQFDPAGVAWFATDGGLLRKDGAQWTKWTTANAPFVHNQIDDVFIAPNGDVWVNNSGVQTTSAAILRLSAGVWTKFVVGAQIPFGPPWNQLSEVLVTPDGHAWVANDVLNGVAEYDGLTWTLRGGSVGRFGHGLVDQNGDLWFVAGIGGGNQFWRYRRAANEWDHFAPGVGTPFANTTITRLGIDSLGVVYCGNWMGQVIRFNGSTFDQVANVGDAVYGIGVAANGDYWITTLGNGATGALHHLDPLGNPIRVYNTWNTGMVDYFIDRVTLDRTGNLWLACGEGGISRFDGTRWRNWGNHNAGSEPYPWAGNEPMGGFYLDAAGAGWMGGNGIGRWDPASGQFTGFWNWQNNPGMGVTNFSSFAEDAAGTVFAGGDYGEVYTFNGSLWVQQPTSPGSYTSNYAGVKSDSQGRVWAMGWLRAWLWDGAAWTEVGQSWSIFDRGGINCFDFGPDDTLWIGTNQGLLRVSPQGQTTFYTTANSPLPAKQVQGIDVRPDGVIALSSHEFLSTTPFPSGVAVITGDPGVAANWKTYRYGAHPIPHYQLGAVCWDADNNLWISALSEGCAVLLADQCYADCNADGTLTVADFGCFQTKFVAGDPYADCNADSQLTVADFGCFQTGFALGCP
ncbi:MAG: hypothetical protein ACKVU4_07690 [Phycisphaerales bacterium]